MTARSAGGGIIVCQQRAEGGTILPRRELHRDWQVQTPSDSESLRVTYEMATLVMAPTNLIRHVSSNWCV